MANRRTGEGVAHAPAELLVRAAAHALLPLGIRPCLELREEDASQGYKTGHMRYVLGIGLGLAALAMLILLITFVIS